MFTVGDFNQRDSLSIDSESIVSQPGYQLTHSKTGVGTTG